MGRHLPNAFGVNSSGDLANAFGVNKTFKSIASVDNDAYADAEVVKSTFRVASKRRRTRHSDGTKISEVEAHGVVIDLKDTHVNARRYAHVKAATNCGCETSIIEVFEPVIKFRQISGSTAHAYECMRKRFPRPFRSIVLYLNSTEYVVQSYRGVVGAKAKGFLMV